MFAIEIKVLAWNLVVDAFKGVDCGDDLIQGEVKTCGFQNVIFLGDEVSFSFRKDELQESLFDEECSHIRPRNREKNRHFDLSFDKSYSTKFARKYKTFFGKVFTESFFKKKKQTYPQNFLSAFFAVWCQIFSIAILAIKMTFTMQKRRKD